MDPLLVTAYATATLAAVGVVSIVANFYLARATSRAARAAQASTVNQETELDLLKRQLELAERQYASAQESARPKLRAEIFGYGTMYTGGRVVYVHGSEPAYRVEIWIRGTPAEGETWGLRTCPVTELMTPGQAASFTAYPATATEQDHLPFDGFLGAPKPEPGFVVVGIIWSRSDGTVDKLVEIRPVGSPGPNDIERFKTS